MTHMQSRRDYDYYNSRYGTKINRRCIDGSITGCGKCVAYCEFAEHTGFLTEKLCEEHQCIEKGCMYYVPKLRTAKNKKQDNSSQIVAIAIDATSEMEGLRVLRATKNNDGTWIIYYVTIAGYMLNEIKSYVEERSGEKVDFEKLEYDFDVASQIIFSQKQSA